ncbi:hypothetical protein [Gracilimonas halophila]|uniref:Uncharacterized protein n=1 Tax=Gracilimonas halophila TaxID=1834464 RepID=A0ABW5JN11_9BACT
MTYLTLLILSLGSLTALVLFGMIFYGIKNRKYMESLGENLDESTTVLKGDFKEIRRSLEGNEKQQERILKRLQNLETIVTSEAWDAIQAGEDENTIGLHLNDEEEEQPDAEEAARRIARKINR